MATPSRDPGTQLAGPLSPGLMYSQEPEAQPQRQQVEMKMAVLRMSSDTQPAQQDHAVHLEAAITNLVKTFCWHPQGAGGRR